MEKNTFQRTVKILTRCRNLLLLLVILLSSALFVLLISGHKEEERIVIVPTKSSYQGFWIEDTCCSKSYLEEIGLFLTDALFTKTPADVHIKNNLVLKRTHPKRFFAIKEALVREKKELERKGQALIFHPTDFYSDPDALKFFVSGIQRVYLDKQKGKMAHEMKVSYCLTFAIKRSQIFLVNIHQTKKERSR